MLKRSHVLTKRFFVFLRTPSASECLLPLVSYRVREVLISLQHIGVVHAWPDLNLAKLYGALNISMFSSNYILLY